MTDILRRYVADHGHVPIGWALPPPGAGYVNLGDALSPAMVTMMTGIPAVHASMVSDAPRLAAVGSIGHSFARGDVSYWGTGSSRYANPLSAGEAKRPFTPPADTVMHVGSTRGPYSRAILTGQRDDLAEAVYGDPVWLLPRFHPAPVEKIWDLGVIIHLVDLADRGFEAHPKPDLLRYGIPPEFAGRVKLFNTVVPATPEGMRRRLDEILSCRRIVSTSLHGMVFAESYGIPCLYFGVRGPRKGLAEIALDIDDDKRIDSRFTDLYLGLGRERLPIYVQDRKRPTDWAAVMAAIDSGWSPITCDVDRLAAACPLPIAPLSVPDGGSVFDHPLIAALPMHHG